MILSTIAALTATTGTSKILGTAVVMFVPDLIVNKIIKVPSKKRINKE